MDRSVYPYGFLDSTHRIEVSELDTNNHFIIFSHFIVYFMSNLDITESTRLISLGLLIQQSTVIKCIIHFYHYFIVYVTITHWTPY